MLGPGDRLGKYELIERLGQGGMAIVFRAYQPGLDRQVAIKILAAGAAQPDFLERFRREARSISRLRHSNILWVFDFGEQDDFAYMVGELVTGGTLADRLGRPLPLEWVGVRLVALASALDYAHANGIVHRDVKPSNVLMTEDELPILSDFGIARMLEETGHLTAAGSVVGTPEYMSPEQAQGFSAGPASDQYSLGIMLYEMVCGRPPYRGTTAVAVALAHVREPPPPPTQINPALPLAVESVILRALEKDPANRWGSAGELAAEFARAIGVDVRELAAQAAVTPPSMPRVSGTNPSVGRPDVAPVRQTNESRGPALLSREPSYWNRPPAPPAGPASDRDTAPGPAARPPIRRSSNGISLFVAGLAIALAAIVGAALLLRPRDGGPPAIAPPTLLVATPRLTTVSPVPSNTPILALVPTATARPATAVPTPTTASPTATIAPRVVPPTPAGPITVTIAEPLAGAVVRPRFAVRGRRAGVQRSDQHLWLLAGPIGGTPKFWPLQKEIVPDATGAWQADVDLGGDPGVAHEVVVALADANGQVAILRQITSKPGEPFEGSLPAGVTRLASVVVVRGA
ncbi:MAG: protein kinase [Chloroflexi bacterium]|nr:protein kinase [Chloroflexota bacterium]